MFIRGEANNASIELSEQERLIRPGGAEYYRVTLRENEFEVTRRVYAFDPTNDGLPEFFAVIARDWKGWEGSRTWSSLEDEFELICEHDRVGHIKATATLHSNPYGHGWTERIRFDLPPGDLDRIAEEVRHFFRTTA
jgi:hypothetical protein